MSLRHFSQLPSDNLVVERIYRICPQSFTSSKIIVMKDVKIRQAITPRVKDYILFNEERIMLSATVSKNCLFESLSKFEEGFLFQKFKHLQTEDNNRATVNNTFLFANYQGCSFSFILLSQSHSYLDRLINIQK